MILTSPDSTFAISIILSIRLTRVLLLVFICSEKCNNLLFGKSGLPSKSENPIMVFIGVRISFDILARKAVFNFSDSKAFSIAFINSNSYFLFRSSNCFRSVMSRIVPERIPLASFTLKITYFVLPVFVFNSVSNEETLPGTSSMLNNFSLSSVCLNIFRILTESNSSKDPYSSIDFMASLANSNSPSVFAI